MIECLDLSLSLVVMDFGHWWMGSPIWKINGPIDDGFVMVERVLMFMHGLMMVGDELLWL